MHNASHSFWRPSILNILKSLDSEIWMHKAEPKPARCKLDQYLDVFLKPGMATLSCSTYHGTVTSGLLLMRNMSGSLLRSSKQRDVTELALSSPAFKSAWDILDETHWANYVTFSLRFAQPWELDLIILIKNKEKCSTAGWTDTQLVYKSTLKMGSTSGRDWLLARFKDTKEGRCGLPAASSFRGSTFALRLLPMSELSDAFSPADFICLYNQRCQAKDLILPAWGHSASRYNSIIGWTVPRVFNAASQSRVCHQ